MSLDANSANTNDPLRWRILAVLLATIFMSLVSVSIVNVALPSIQHSLHADTSDLQWVLSGYALTFGVMLVAAGRAGDIFGRGGIFILGVLVFISSSVVAGLAPTPAWLNGARFMQGVGSGLLSPQGLGMIQQYFRGPERGRAFGYFGSMVGISVGIGPVIGGILIELGGPDLGWRLAFLVNVPVAALIIFLALRWFPRPLIQFPSGGSLFERISRTLAALDPIGALLLGAAVLCSLLPFVETHVSHWIWALLPFALLLLYAWVRWEGYYARSGRAPMVDLGIFSASSFANGTLIMALYFLGMTSVWVIVALYMQEAVGKSAFEAGLVGIPAAMLSALAANWAGKNVNRLGRRIVIGGIWLGIIGMLLSMAVVYLQALGLISVWWLVLSLAFVGLAQGSVISPNQTLTLEQVPLQYAGSSGAIMQTGQRIGTSIGIAVITAVVFGTLHHGSWAMALCTGFAVIALVLTLALIVAYKDYHQRKKAPSA